MRTKQSGPVRSGPNFIPSVRLVQSEKYTQPVNMQCPQFNTTLTIWRLLYASYKKQLIQLLLLGRINVVDLHQILNVDLRHVESKVDELLKRDDSLVLIQGDLIEV